MQAILSYFARFSELTPQAQDAIQAICKVIEVKKNTDLQPIGHTCKTIYFLRKGLARIYYFKDATDVTESFAFENNIVVRYESLLSARPSRKGIQMLEDSEVIAISAKDWFRLFDTHHEIERLFRKICEAALVEQINRIESLQFHTAEERYNALIRENPDVLKRVPLKYIASYLGITPVSLSRIRGQK